jgi:hypothetical protein
MTHSSNSECDTRICCPQLLSVTFLQAHAQTSVVVLVSHQHVAQDRPSFGTHLCAYTYLSGMGVTKLKRSLTGTHNIRKNFPS